MNSFAGPRAFARHMLRDDRLLLRPVYERLMTFRGSILESILFREGCWQVELIAAMPNAGTEVHRHLRCSSADLLLNAALPDARQARGDVLGESDVSQPKRGPLAAQLRTIGKGQWHGGQAGPEGLIYLSFQQWDGEPDFISQDWDT